MVLEEARLVLSWRWKRVAESAHAVSALGPSCCEETLHADSRSPRGKSGSFLLVEACAISLAVARRRAQDRKLRFLAGNSRRTRRWLI